MDISSEKLFELFHKILDLPYDIIKAKIILEVGQPAKVEIVKYIDLKSNDEVTTEHYKLVSADVDDTQGDEDNESTE